MGSLEGQKEKQSSHVSWVIERVQEFGQQSLDGSIEKKFTRCTDGCDIEEKQERPDSADQGKSEKGKK